MRFVLEIACDGEPFKDDLRGEIIDVLQHVIDQLTTPPLSGAIHDGEGNPIGSWRFIAAPGPDPDGVSSPDLGMVMAGDEGFARAAKP